MEFSAVAEKKREIVVLFAVVVILLALWYLGSGVIAPKPLDVYFSKGEIPAGGETTLFVKLSNLMDMDVKNVTISVEPESKAITIQNPYKTEPVIGKGSYRLFEFSVKVPSNVTSGAYAITVKAEMGGEELVKLTHIVIK
ncbi:MAG: hypothetical protein J7L23_02520 [Candidatus Diapherotrites archaeon]|nr:hypothetical protein [Candidatus Diapherotrites archaeon]